MRAHIVHNKTGEPRLFLEFEDTDADEEARALFDVQPTLRPCVITRDATSLELLDLSFTIDAQGGSDAG